MKKLVNHAYDRALNLVWPQCVQWHRLYDYNVRYPRYPAPGSEPTNHSFNESDYKTAYRDSIHHVRFLDFEQDHEAKYVFFDPINETDGQKLVRLKYLKEADLEVLDLVAVATKAYESNHGEPLQNKVHANEIQDEAWDTMVKNKFSRESLAFFVQDQFQSTNQVNSQYPIENDFGDLYHPEQLEMRHIDMVSHDPVFRQLIVDQTYLLKRITVLKFKYYRILEVVVEVREYLKVILASGMQQIIVLVQVGLYFDNKTENIKRVQSAVGDKISNLDTTALDLVQNRNEYHVEVEVPFPIKSKFAS